MTKTEIEKALALATSQQLASALVARRKVSRGARPKVLRKCKKCGVKLGAREMRAHKCDV